MCGEAFATQTYSPPVAKGPGNGHPPISFPTMPLSVRSSPEPAPSAPPPRAPDDKATIPASILTLKPRSGITGYEILGELGRGGMGVVYKARQLGLNRIVALKMILAGAHAGPDQIALFRGEAEAVARLQHPNIVQIYDIEEQDGWHFFSMEFVNGGSLDKWTAPHPPQQAAQLIAILADAIAVAHDLGIVHRDLKPANVLLLGVPGSPLNECIPKITDFGVAKHLDNETWKTRSGALMGTPTYMAPEQASGQQSQVSPVTDVYALGAILYELLTGRPPFLAPTMMETLELVRFREPVPPSRIMPRLPRDLETICLKCLQKEPGKRYRSARDLAADLRRFLAYEPIKARPISLGERALKWMKRKRGLVAFYALVLVSAGVIGSIQIGSRYQRLRELGREVDRSVANAEEVIARENWGPANAYLTSALEKLGSEQALKEKRARILELKETVEARLAAAKQALEERDRYQQAIAQYDGFFKLHDEALFHSTLAFGEGLEENRRQARQAAERALALVGVSATGAGRPQVADELPAGKRSELGQGCYVMLLVLADALSPPSAPGTAEHARQSLQLLDQADHLRSLEQAPFRAYHLRRARYLSRTGAESEAAQERQQGNRQPVAGAPDYYLLGEESYKKGELRDALSQFENALLARPDHQWARYFFAVCYLRLNRPAEAKATLTAFLSQRQDFVWIYLLRGYASTQLGPAEYPAAEADFDKAAKLEPRDDALYALYTNRGVLRLRQQKYAEAIADFQAAIALRPSHYQGYVSLAQVYQVTQRWQEAIACYDQAVAKEPRLAVLYRNRAQLHLERKDWEAALKDCERAITETPAGDTVNRARDQAERGRILHHLGRYDQATAAYDAALRIDPDYTDPFLWRGEALVKLRRYPEAAQSYDRYLEHARKPPVEVYQARGNLRARLDRYPEAIPDYTRALDLQPDNVAVRAARGWAYLICNSPKLALPDFEQVLERQPDNGEAYAGRGSARVRLGHYREAVADAEEVARRLPESASMIYNAARIFAQAAGYIDAHPEMHGRLAAARAGYQKRALALLRQAMKLQKPADRARFWKERVMPDIALYSVRSLPEFTTLAANYGK
jgi:tetratricopeptide (TPR) repeat protein